MIDPEVIRPERLRPLRRSEYHQMVRAGAFAKERVELLYGMLVGMSPQGTRHVYAVRRLNEVLTPRLVGRAAVLVQMPLALATDSEPEPDLAVVALGEYLDDHPTTALLVVEVADSSLRDDRAVKGRLYAEAGIPEYWLVDVNARRVERYLAPDAGRYTRLTTHGATETIAIAAFPDVTVALARVLPA